MLGLETLSNALGAVKEFFGFQKEKLLLNNSPAMQDAAERAKEQKMEDAAVKAIKDGDDETIRKNLS